MTTSVQKIVISRCHGGFGLSKQAFQRLAELGHPAARALVAKNPTQSFKWRLSDEELSRNDPRLVQVAEELGSAADGDFASLGVIEVPADVEWQIQDYDGWEWIAEKHRTWGEHQVPG